MQQAFPNEAAAGDLAHLRSSMQAIEQACSAIQMHTNPSAAEATILALRQSPRPYQLCQFILENSQLPNARFQAAAAIRDAAMREWAFLNFEDKKNLIRFCLCYAMQHASSTEAYVQVKVSAVGAQLLKRGWLEFTAERDTFFLEIKKAIVCGHGIDAQFTAINFLESLVSEFAPSTSTAMGLSAEFHEQCQSSLEVNYLKPFYFWAQDAVQSVANKIVECRATVSELKVCSAAIRLMFQILNWDFHCITTGVKSTLNRRTLPMSRPTCSTPAFRKFERILVQPGPTWRDVLISSGHICWILGFYGALRQKLSHDGSWFDSPVAVSARQLIVQLCSLTGTIFSSDNGPTQDSHLLQMLSEVVHWISPPEAVLTAIKCGKSESEMLDGCRALLSVANMVRPVVLDKLLKSVSPFDTASLLSALTCEVVKTKAGQAAEEDTWRSEALDSLLDTWNVILVASTKPADDPNDSTQSPEGRAAAAMVFGVVVESELKAASESVYEEGDDSEHFEASISARDDKLSSYALIARAAADFTILHLMNQFSERFSVLHRMQKGQQTGDPTCILEELYWLLLITGHVLADAGDGETPLVPEAFQFQFASVSDATNHPVVVLSGSIITFCEQSLNPELRSAFFSPRLMEAVIWFLARWADTYLMPPEASKAYSCVSGHVGGLLQISEDSCKALHNFFGEHNQGKQMLDVIVRIALTSIMSYSGENDLQALTCQQLLPSLVKRKNVCAHLITLESWRNLAGGFANERALYSLAPSLQRSIAESLCRSISAMTNTEANQYVKSLMGQVISYLVDISSKNDIKAIAEQPDVILMVSCLLERLRGAARATQPRNQKAIFDVGVDVMKSLLILLEVYKNESAVIYKLLKFVVDWVDGQVGFLEAKETVVVIGFCMQLFQLYSSHNIGKISLSRSSNILSEEKMEKYKDLRALLQLLANLCSKDLVDFSSGSEVGDETDIGQVVFLGLHIVTPLISVELLKYPKLSRDYFALLSHLLEVYPEKVAQLNDKAFEHIIGTLDFGIRHQDADIVDNCLSALSALASFHYSERSRGKEGLGSHAAGYNDPNGNVQRGILSHFLQSLLHLVLFEDYRSDLVGSAADALLPLILCEQGLYQQWSKDLIERQMDPMLQLRLAKAIQSLTSSNQVSSTLDRVNRKRFRSNLEIFLNDVRGFLRTF